MTLAIYLTFHGDCEEAMRLYADLLGGTITTMMYIYEAPGAEQFPAARRDWIMHAELTLGGTRILASDDIMGGTPPMRGTSIVITPPDAERGREIFEALAQGGKVRTDYRETFFSPGFGTLTDRFGVQWMIATEDAAEKPQHGAIS